MARTICADCQGPREAHAPQPSYCIACTRRRQRERYAKMREAAGHTVRSRTDDISPAEQRRQQLIAGQGSPGRCEVCREPEPDALVLIRSSDPSNTQQYEADLYGGGEMSALWCAKCRALSKVLATTANLQRAVTLAEHLARLGTPLDNVLPDMGDVMQGITTYTPATGRTKAP